MEIKRKKKTILFLALLSLLYFCALIPANLIGAETPEMLEVFEVDEYAQYPHLIRMLTPGDSLYQSLRKFFIYLHYFFGFPFYFWSALSVLPLKLFAGVWPGNTRVIVCVLRQMISVLPMIFSAGLLTWIFTKFRSTLISVILFSFLLTMPAVLLNDFWWHPDSLTLFFLCLTFFFLDRDRMRCGRNFLFAAFFCGAAIGTKYLGFYFVLAIPAYLLCCRFAGTIGTKQIFGKAAVFVLVMAAAVIFSDPLLLLPQERAEIFGIMKQQTELSGSGIFLRYENTFLENGRLPLWLTDHYMGVFMIVLSAAGLVCAIILSNRVRRTMAILLICYLGVACTINLNAAASRLHYYLPIMLPLACCPVWLGDVFPDRFRKTALILLCALFAVQIGLNLRTDVQLMKTQLHREENSGSIALYEELHGNFLPLPEVPAERMTRVYRDWKAYFPEQEGYVILTDWNLASFPLVEEWQPDLILLEKENIRAYSTADIAERAVNADKMADAAAFYSAAAEKMIPGYEFLTENNFGMVFRKALP